MRVLLWQTLERWSWSVEFIMFSVRSGWTHRSRLALGSGRSNALVLNPEPRPADERPRHERAQIGPAQTLTHTGNDLTFTLGLFGPQRADHYRCVCVCVRGRWGESDLMKADWLSAASLPVQPSPFPVSPSTASCVPNISRINRGAQWGLFSYRNVPW